MFLTYVHAEIITYCAPVLICVFSTKLTSGKAHPSFNLFPFLFHQDIRRSEECGSCFPATGVDYVSRKPPMIHYCHLLSFNFVYILISPHTLLFTMQAMFKHYSSFPLTLRAPIWDHFPFS